MTTVNGKPEIIMPVEMKGGYCAITAPEARYVLEPDDMGEMLARATKVVRDVKYLGPAQSVVELDIDDGSSEPRLVATIGTPIVSGLPLIAS